MMLELRRYQERSLDTLANYLKRSVEIGVDNAFREATGRNHIFPPGLENRPYVCLRIPTGGGKTLMASHSIGIAAREFLQVERAVCLWLVPSNIIREQTLAALKDREHPYRQVLDARFDGNVRVLNLDEALSLKPAALSGETVVIVSTLAAPRIGDVETRKIY
jgi:type III restriction enzyme